MTRRVYTEEEAVACMLAWAAERGGEQPTLDRWRATHAAPSTGVLIRLFGSFPNAVGVAAVIGGQDWDPLPQHVGRGPRTDETENEELLRRARGGVTLVDLANELGITGQALGRRLREHCKRTGQRPIRFAPGRRTR